MWVRYDKGLSQGFNDGYVHEKEFTMLSVRITWMWEARGLYSLNLGQFDDEINQTVCREANVPGPIMNYF